jgi:DNA polymerase-3 subunit alpha
LFDTIEGFADYAFNKSHSYGYGLIAYQTAYLKAHYPVEYLACLLTSVKSNLDKAAIYLAECRNLGVRVLNPDVNVSESDFVALDTDDPRVTVDLPPGCRGVIPFGLSAVRNVGEGLVELILAERRANGPFTDFYEFVERVDPAVLNKRSVESLVKAGAFDAMGHRRRGLLVEFERIIDTTMQRRRERDQGVMSLFGDVDGHAAFDERIPIPDIEFDKTPRLRFEKEMLGLYVSDHPLLGAEWALRRRVDCTVAEAAERDDGTSVTLGGVVTGLTRKFTKRGDPMAVFQLEDLQSSIEVTVFPKTMLEQGYKLADDLVITVRGRIDTRDETTKLMGIDITVLEAMGDAPELRLRVPARTLSDDRIDHLKRLLLEHPGTSPVVLDLGGNRLRLPDDYRVDLSGVVGELRVAFGHDAVAL